MRVVNFINQLQRTAISTSQIGGLVGPRNRVDNLKIEITVTARNWALDCPAHCTATTDWPIPAPQQKHEGHFKIQWYWSSINTLCFTRVMINIRHVNQTGSLLLYDLKAITNFISYPEETGSRLLWNTGNEIPQRAVSLPRTKVHDLFTKHHHHHHHHYHHPSWVTPWYTWFTKHVTLIQLPHSNPSFLNSITILSSNLHPYLYILVFMNHPFVWISHFVHMCICPTCLTILGLTVSGFLSDTDQHLWKSHSSLILLEALTLPIKKTISLYWPCYFSFFE